PRRGHLDEGHQQGAPRRREAARRNGVDQLLQHLRRRSALRRIQAVRLGTRDGQGRPRDVYRGEGSLHDAVVGSGIETAARSAAVFYVCICLSFGEMINFAAVAFCTSSALNPGATSSRTSPWGVTWM